MLAVMQFEIIYRLTVQLESQVITGWFFVVLISPSTLSSFYFGPLTLGATSTAPSTSPEKVFKA